jgi:large subunit ribosomal protein L17
MHAHYHTVSKLSRKIGPRNAVMKGLLESLVVYERIETTLAKARAIKPAFDKLVTKAKRGGLQNIRVIHAELGSKIAADKLTQELVHGFESRNSGYTRLVKTGWRRGDAAEMMMVELVLDEDFEDKLKKLQKSNEPAKKVETDKKGKGAK